MNGNIDWLFCRLPSDGFIATTRRTLRGFGKLPTKIRPAPDTGLARMDDIRLAVKLLDQEIIDFLIEARHLGFKVGVPRFEISNFLESQS